MTIELNGGGGGGGGGVRGGGDDEGWGGKLGVPEVENLSQKQKDAVERMFRGCDNLNCVPPRKPWPDHREPCRRPDR